MGYKRTVRYGSPGGSLLLRFFILASPGENTTSYVEILWKLRLAYVVSFGFLNEEYLIALVDFIVALRRTKGRGRRTLRSPPSPSSGLHLIHPGMSAAAGHICCRGGQGFRIPVSGASRLSPLRYIVWGNCVRAEVACVSVGFVWLGSFVFHYWVEKRRCLFGFDARFWDYHAMYCVG